jgi:hypothetical protein
MHGQRLEHFLHGEGYRKSPEVVHRFVENLPMTEVPTRLIGAPVGRGFRLAP